MPSQAELKRLRALQQKRDREQSGRFLVQGRKVVSELLLSRYGVEQIVATEEAAAFIAPLAERRRTPVHVLPPAELDRIGTFEKGNELIAVAIQPAPLAFRAAQPGELILALDGVRDPRNMGSLYRIADWFGCQRLILSAECMEPFNPKAVSSTMGSLFRIETHIVGDLAAELRAQRTAGVQIYIADMDGTAAFATQLALPGVLVLGSESHGHSTAVAAIDAQVISIPRVGHAESLNVAMAAAALCMEFTRQKAVR